MARPHPIQWLRAHPRLADASLATLLAAISIVGLATVDQELGVTSNRDAEPLAYALMAVAFGMVALRRRSPVAALWLATAAIVPYWILDYVDSGISVAVLVLLYTLAANVDPPRSIRAALGVGAVLTAVMIAGVLVEEEELPAIAVVANVVIFSTAWFIGDSVRNRRAYLAEVEARADRAERDRETATVRAVQEERVRIARELHDVVAHSVSVMVVQASAGRRILDRDPTKVAEALEVIESTGRGALDELRRLLGVLREDQSTVGTEPQPSAESVSTLVQQCRDAGMDVDLVVDGDEGAAELPPGVGLTVFRVVQEALTNVMKHAGPARVEVHLRLRDDVVTIQVTDDGRGPAPEWSSLPSAGQGLIGMRERVELFGGELRTGPRPGGGFVVRAEVPLRSPVGLATPS